MTALQNHPFFVSMEAWREASLAGWRCFLEKWPHEKLVAMTFACYIVGEDPDTFCEDIVRDPDAFSSIAGGSPRKFGMYYSKARAAYILGDEPVCMLDEDFEVLIAFLLDTVHAAEKEDWVELRRCYENRGLVYPILFWRLVELYQPIERPYLLPVCREKVLKEIYGGEFKDAFAIQQDFGRRVRISGDYWAEAWKATMPLREGPRPRRN